MKNGLKITVFSFIILILISCGHKKKPTGGPKDTIKPKILSVQPLEYSEIDKTIKILFSKEIDKNSIYNNGISIYPPILKKKYQWENNLLIIKIFENLEDSTNYFFKFSKNIMDIHQNHLDQTYIYVFYKTELQNYTINGNIKFENPNDYGKKINLSLFTADSILVFSKKFNTNYYKFDFLNKDKYFVTAFIDLNKNNRYDKNSEPFSKVNVTDLNHTKADLFLTYLDTTKPHLKKIQAIYNNKIVAYFTENVVSLKNIQIFSYDSLKINLSILDTLLSNDSLTVITQKQDSTKYMMKLYEFQDKKNNVTYVDSIVFNYSSKNDTIAPMITNIYPGNGTVVKIDKPIIKIESNEIIKKISIRMLNSEDDKEVPLQKLKENKIYFSFEPVFKLKNYSSYTIYIDLIDYKGNKKEVQTKFIVLAEK